MRIRTAFVSLLCLLITAIAPAPAAGVTFRVSYAKALASLVVAPEVRTGYVRDKFRHWIDADDDGCDARDEVLIAESKSAVTVGASCRLTGGEWVSAYDDVRVSDPRDLDIDHMVPLAEAWDSGARTWTAAQRQAFANDLGDPRSLIAVTASSNRSKSDQDPSTWLPEVHVCQYVRNWIAVKVRWRLSVDQAEKAALRSALAPCAPATLTVTLATVPKASRPTQEAPTATPTSSSAVSVYYANCTAARAAGAAPVRRGDPGYRAGLDRDGDGVGCE